MIDACNHDVDIINMSLGGYRDPNTASGAQDYLLWVDAVNYCRTRGTAIFASAGNEHVRVNRVNLAVGGRARALGQATGAGGMLVLFCHARRARSLLEALGPASLEIAVVNLPEQTVVSGSEADLERLTAFSAQAGVRSTRLESSFPFHSRLLAPCVAPFAEALR